MEFTENSQFDLEQWRLDCPTRQKNTLARCIQILQAPLCDIEPIIEDWKQHGMRYASLDKNGKSLARKHMQYARRIKLAQHLLSNKETQAFVDGMIPPSSFAEQCWKRLLAHEAQKR